MSQITLQQVTTRTISRHKLLSNNDKVLVALSGGADSVALLLVLKQLGYDIEALHCNFHLRGDESNRDESFVRQLCEEQEIPLTVQSFDTQVYCKEQKVSIEMGARELRYKWFEEKREESKATAIAVAHHRQDQAETLLMNLLRGSGLRGLAGMHYKNGYIIRPLLDASKQDILDFLTSQGQEWVEDSTNQERDAMRNRIRLDVLPLLESINPKAVDNLARTAAIVQDSLPMLTGSLQPASFTELHEAIRHCEFSRTQETDIWEAQTGAIIESTNYRLQKDRNKYILRSKGYTPTPPELCFDTRRKSAIDHYDAHCAYFDKKLIKTPLTLRLLRQGDRFVPFGMTGSKLVSDLLTDLKLNRFEKEDQFVLVDNEDKIVWVIGRRTSNEARVTDATEEVLVVSVKKE